ncbi:MAG: MlaD family protein, partial [Mycobacterium sp.]
MDRNPIPIAVAGLALTAVAVVIALGYKSFPLINTQRHYSAYFTEAGGLAAGAAVQVSGNKMGQVSDVALDGSRVRVDFTLDKAARLGDLTEAAIKTRSLLGTRTLEVTPRGSGSLEGAIPLERTIPPYQLTDAVG